MDEHVQELERARQLPVIRLAGLFVSTVAALTTLVAAWENLALRAMSLVLLGALVIYLLERGFGRPASSRAGSRGIPLLRRAGSVVTVALVSAALVWTWGLYTAPDLHITQIRVGQLSGGGGSVLVALDGGTRADLVTEMTVLSSVEQIGGCGGAEFEVITVSPTVALTSREGDSVVVHGQQESSLQPGAQVRIEGGMDSDHCGDSSWLTLRPQQPVAANSLDQILVEIPAAFEIESSTYHSEADARPVQSVLDEGTFEDFPAYADYLRTILPGMKHPVLTWPWTFERAALEAEGWRAVLFIAVTSASGDCVVAAADLMSDGTPLLAPQEASVALASSKTRSHIPASCA